MLDLSELQIIAFRFYLTFTKRPNSFGIRIALLYVIASITQGLMTFTQDDDTIPHHQTLASELYAGNSQNGYFFVFSPKHLVSIS